MPSEGPARGVVLFAQGSGRLSPRNSYIASALRRAGLATLLFDLLNAEEAARGSRVFDIPLLAGRLAAAAEGLLDDAEVGALPQCFFGTGTGAAAALVAAAELGPRIAAVVSRSGRPHLAGHFLATVESPTLLIVGGADPDILALNRAAQARLLCTSRLEIVPGATHLFLEPGTLDVVVSLARDWFLEHLN